MNNWNIVISFTYPHEAHLAKAKLESEGIEVLLKDELTTQVNNYYSNAIGGVKLLVKDSEFEKALNVLIDSGYINEEVSVPNKFWTKFDSLTSKLPLIGKSLIEMRLLTLVAVLLIIIIVPIFLLTLPSTREKLTENIWCVDKIYYKGQELIPHTLGYQIVSVYDNCTEKMQFHDNIVDLPGINSNAISALFELRNDSLFISDFLREVNIEFDENLKPIETKKDTSKKSIYQGAYKLYIENKFIKIESKDLTIIGQVYQFNFRF